MSKKIFNLLLTDKKIEVKWLETSTRTLMIGAMKAKLAEKARPKIRPGINSYSDLL